MKNIELIVNGKLYKVEDYATKRLIDFLREELHLKGAKEGCGEGECGACSILLNNKLVNSCIIALGSVEGMSITTIEGLRDTQYYKVLEASFIEAGAVQCGFCTPGMVMAAHALLLQNPEPTIEEIQEGISGNLCRCTGYNMIVEAVYLAAKNGGGIWG